MDEEIVFFALGLDITGSVMGFGGVAAVAGGGEPGFDVAFTVFCDVCGRHHGGSERFQVQGRCRQGIAPGQGATGICPVLSNSPPGGKHALRVPPNATRGS